MSRNLMGRILSCGRSRWEVIWYKDQLVIVDLGIARIGMLMKDWIKLDQKRKSTIQPRLSDLVLLDVLGESTTKALWNKLWASYQFLHLIYPCYTIFSIKIPHINIRN